MSYFPEDIPFMSEEELKYHGIKIPKDESNKHLFSFIPTEEEAKETLLIDELKESLTIKDCPLRHKNGNCIAGGFCTANKNICTALREAYEKGKRDAQLKFIDGRG